MAQQSSHTISSGPAFSTMKPKLAFVGLGALGMTALALLLLHLTLLCLLLCWPAIPLLLIFAAFTDFVSPLSLVMATVTGYAIFFFIAVFLTNWSPNFLRLTKVMVLPTLLLVVLACIPALDPMWPKGMSALKRKESALPAELSEGQSLDCAKQVLRARGISFHEQVQEANVESPLPDSARISPGDTLLFNHLGRFDVPAEGGAYQFPCRYDLQVILVFGADQKLKWRHIGHTRLCP
jgi:hypothetical protein